MYFLQKYFRMWFRRGVRKLKLYNRIGCMSRSQLVYVYPMSKRRPICASPQPPPRRRMSLASLFNSWQRPHRHGGPSSESHSQLDDPHDDRKVSALSAHPPGLSTHIGVGPPGWEHLIHSPLTTSERVSLITTVLSSRDEVGIARRLHGDDAQAFVDVVYEARSCVL